MGMLANGARGELPVAPIDMATTARRFQRLMQQLRGTNELLTDRVRTPSGGGIAFELPGDSPDHPIIAQEIVGVIIKYSFANAYWVNAYGSGDNAKPDCSSNDGISGFDRDDNETPCHTCPRNRFGSAGDGRGKACRNMVQLYVLMEGEPLPIEVIVPTMSVQNFKAYIIRQLSPRDLDAWNVLTRITLSKASNANGIQYSQMQFQAIGRVEDEQLEPIRQEIVPMLGYVRFDDPQDEEEKSNSGSGVSGERGPSIDSPMFAEGEDAQYHQGDS